MRLGFVLIAIFTACLVAALPTTALAQPDDNFYWTRDPAVPIYDDGYGTFSGRSTTRETVRYETRHKPGTIIVDTQARKLYLVQKEGRALSYGVGVGRPGFTWDGTHRVTRKAEWPGWTPPPEMRKRQPYLPAYMPGGPNNPLGARALYLGSTLYRIHGTAEANTIGQAVSSGCFRMLNKDVIDLYERVEVGARVVVLR